MQDQSFQVTSLKEDRVRKTYQYQITVNSLLLIFIVLLRFVGVGGGILRKFDITRKNNDIYLKRLSYTRWQIHKNAKKIIIYQVDFPKISADSKINLVYSLLYYVFCSNDIKSILAENQK